jgi:hypothetical protein
MTWILAAKLPLSTLVSIAAIGGLFLLAWSYSHWRAAVKTALVLALFEGAIRKWLWPGGGDLVYFLKDGVLLGAYLRFFMAPDPDIRAFRLDIGGTAILLLGMVVAFGAINPNIGSPILALLGIKFYLYYIPLAFMMPYLFRTQEEMVRQLTWFAFLGIPICALGFLQWRSDAFSVLNTYAAGGLETGATGFGTGSNVRVTGTFSYITGHTTFVTFFCALNLALLAIKETPYKWLIFGVGLPMLAANSFMGGSRGAVLTAGILVLGFTVASFSANFTTSKHFKGILLAGSIVCLAAGTLFFSDAVELWSARRKSADDNVTSRVVSMPMEALVQAFSESGATGYGIGLTQGASSAMRNVLKIPAPRKKPPVFDTEPGQILAELGLFGFLAWYGLRIYVWFALWASFLRSPPGILKTISLAAFILYGPYMIMSLVLNHTANILLWALVGLAFTCRLQPTVQRRFANPRARPGQVPVPLRGRRV